MGVLRRSKEDRKGIKVDSRKCKSKIDSELCSLVEYTLSLEENISSLEKENKRLSEEVSKMKGKFDALKSMFS